MARIETPDIDLYMDGCLKVMGSVYGSQKTMYTVLRDVGVGFVPKETEPRLIGTPKECFSNSFKLAQDSGLIYCEGLAMIPGIIPVHHAWCVDDTGNLFDPTWKSPGSEYKGIPFDVDYVAEALYNSGIYGIMDNYCFRRFYQDDTDQFIYKGELANV